MTREGWKCPQCKVVWAPFIPMCECTAPQKSALQQPSYDLPRGVGNGWLPQPIAQSIEQYNQETDTSSPALRCRACYSHGIVTIHSIRERCPWEGRQLTEDR